MTSLLASLRQCMTVTFPPVMLQLLEEAVKPIPDFDTLARILAMDPMLTATVLSLANSPYYGSAQKVTDIHRAATILGTKELVKIALSISYQKHLNEAFEKQGIDFFANWRLIVWSAIAAELLSERLCPGQGDQVYVSALLKDIALLLLACADPQHLRAVHHQGVLTAINPGQLDQERDAWRMNHCELTASLLEEWNVPLPSPDCVSQHHDFEHLDGYDPHVRCIILATRWSEMEMDATQPPGVLLHFRAMLRRTLDLSQEDMEALQDRCAQRFQSMLQSLGIAESPPNERLYLCSLKSMQEYHFLASELSSVSGGRMDVARTIGRHLKWEWDLEDWELALGIPNYRDWTLFSCSRSQGVSLVRRSEDFGSLPWVMAGGVRHVLGAEGFHLGELRLPKRGLSDGAVRQIALYAGFVSQSYADHALRQSMLELKAHTMDQLPVGVSRLSPDGVVLEMNSRLREFLGVDGDGRGQDLMHLLDQGMGYRDDGAWKRFLEDPEQKKLHKIFCLWKDSGHATDACVYVAAEKRPWQDRHEVLTFLEDVTLVTGWEFEALKQGEFLEKLIRHMRDVVFSIDHGGLIGFASPRVSELVGQNLFQAMRPTSLYHGPWGPELLVSAPGPVEVLAPLGGETEHSLELIFSPLPKSRGEREWLVVGRDVTIVRRLEDKLKRLALFDGLTGLLNHYQVNVVLEREVARAKRTQRPVGLIFFDLDDFKAVNDVRGHQAGDTVLRGVARVLKAGLRKGMDYPCRYGGDEFAVVATEIEPAQLENMARRIHAAVKEQFKDVIGLSMVLAVHIPGELPSQLLRRADQAAYTAKSQGGRRLLWAQ